MRRAALAVLALVGLAAGPAMAACIAPPPEVPAAALKALARGVNVGGWMDGPGSAKPNFDTLRRLRKAGLTHIRLPVPAELSMRRFSGDAALDQQSRAIDAALTDLLAMDFSVSLDMHPGEQFSKLHRSDPAGAMAAMQDGWRRLAQIVARHPTDRVFAELLNEPDIDPARWQGEAEQLAAFVRGLLPRTTLIVGPTNWQRADSLPLFKPLGDLNVVYAIHVYDPMVFTHQGHWDPKDPLSDIGGLPFPIRADDPAVQDIRRELIALRKARALNELDKAIAQSAQGDVIASQLQPAVDWQATYKRPLIVNEFGVFKAQAPRDSRLRWLRAVVDAADRHCWGWTHWEFEQGFGLADPATGEIDTGVLRALIGPR
jgi:endoglucanase